MSFNSVDGTFTLEGGNATTDDLTIVSPAADIAISGRTGLRSKDYDQEMVVTPRAGVALPVVGALAGGPVGAAAGLVVQSLLGRKINRAASSTYRVTGSWEKPEIVLISKNETRNAAADSPQDAAPPSTQPESAPAPWLPEYLRERTGESPVEPAAGPVPHARDAEGERFLSLSACSRCAFQIRA